MLQPLLYEDPQESLTIYFKHLIYPINSRATVIMFLFFYGLSRFFTVKDPHLITWHETIPTQVYDHRFLVIQAPLILASAIWCGLQPYLRLYTKVRSMVSLYHNHTSIGSSKADTVTRERIYTML
jgi:hypothetical protein